MQAQRRWNILIGLTTLIFVGGLAAILLTRQLAQQEESLRQVLSNAYQTATVAVAILRATNTTTPSLTTTFTLTATSTFTETASITPSLTITPSVTPSDTATSTPSLTPTITPTPTLTLTATPTLTATASMTPTASWTPRFTATPTATFTPLPFAPKPVKPLPSNDDLFNILLLGSDQRKGDPAYRTDTMMVVSVNRTTNTVNVLSLPRDLYVYIPTYGYDRLNTAAIRGDLGKWPGHGVGLLADTITYNFGIRIDRYAEVNFTSFKKMIDSLDGVDVAVDCPLSDYRLTDPKLDPNVAANYRWTTLPIGYHHMDGALALWYARSRTTSSDFERVRRQQIVLRAIWRKAQEEGWLNRLPEMWNDILTIVDTNLVLSDVLGMMPLASDLNSSRVTSFILGSGYVRDWTTPDGAQVLVPLPEQTATLLARFYLPPTLNRLYIEQPTVALYNGTPNTAWLKVAASRLAWEGFIPHEMDNTDSLDYRSTVIYDFTGGAKPASLRLLSRVLNVPANNILNAPDPNRQTDFKIILGASYNSCTR